ncbi:MAG: hypothetical protein O2856_10535 [Planctomycetota bacterium]|nr:hypothetical protein [Planctomycetota bacterium]
MINLASPVIRAALPVARSIAFLGNPADGISTLESKITASSTPIDQLVAMIAICEILHFDYRDTEALNVFEQRVAPMMGAFPETVEIAVAYNRSDIMHSLFQNDDFYGLVDRATITDVELWDYRAYYSVVEAREQGKRYDSLPNIWRELIRAYHQGCWRPYRLASKLMAIECMELGWPHESIYHAVIAGEKETATRLGNFLLLHGTPDSISASTAKWLDCTNLKRQFVVGCEILDRYVDAIPDDLFDDVFERVRTNAAAQTSDRQEQTVVSRAWDSMANLSSRLNPTQAQRLVSTAIDHPIWNAPIEGGNRVLTVRDKMMKSLTACAAKLPKENLPDLIRASLPLVIERKQHTDYPNGIELLCSLAHAGGDEAKQQIKEALYPSGQQLDAYLLQVASNFAVELKKPDSLSQDAKNVAARIREQVQTVPVATDVKQAPGTFGFHTVVKGDDKLIVHVANAVHEHAIFRHRKQLSHDALQELIDAILDMVGETENLINNKIGLVQAMSPIGDVCSDDQAQQIFDALSTIAHGHIIEPESTQSAAESQNPLNPFKMGSGKPTDLRGVTIFALACIERDKPGIFAAKLDAIIELGLTDADPQVRALSLAAAREKPTISEAEFTAIILATRDSDPAVANAAFGALANKEGLQLTRPQWRLLIHSAKLAVQSNEVLVRRAAAYTCANCRTSVSTKTLRSEIENVLDALANDRCASVRQNIK